MSAKYENNLAAASQRFAAVLRSGACRRDHEDGLRDRRHLLFGGDGRRLWTTTFESDWHRYIGSDGDSDPLDATAWATRCPVVGREVLWMRL